MEELGINQPDLDFSLQRVEHFMAEARNHGLTQERIVVLGFSQSACLACEYLYRHPGRWGSFIAFTGGLMGPDPSWPTVGRSLKGTPALFTNSDCDAWVPLVRTQQTATVFREAGA
jgi:phospholipase/carboxylesterase